MAYYRVTLGSEVVDVLTDPVWVGETRRGVKVVCELEDARGVVSSEGNLWRLDGREAFSEGDYDAVQLVEISEEDAAELQAILGLGGTIDLAEESVDFGSGETEVEELPEDGTLDEVKAAKLRLLRADCETAITDGCDVTLPDGTVGHYDLTVEDQINLLMLQGQIEAGAETVPYHATGELCRGYSAAELAAIIEAATAHKLYHTSYYNSLKNYVQELKSITAVAAIQYGDAVPEEYCSEVLLELLKE